MPAADWASECRDALVLGYRDFKTKGRPWHDIYAQMDATQEIVPDDFRIDMDFSATFSTPTTPSPSSSGWRRRTKIFAIWEGPINDLEDSRGCARRSTCRSPITASLRLSEPYEGYDPPRLVEVAWPNGAEFYCSSGNQLWRDAEAGNMPVFIPDVKRQVVANDDSAWWQDMHQRALGAPVREGDAFA